MCKGIGVQAGSLWAFPAVVTPTVHLGRGEKGRRVPGRVRNSVAMVAEPLVNQLFWASESRLQVTP